MRSVVPLSVLASLAVWFTSEVNATPTPSVPVCPSKSNVFGIRKNVDGLRGGALLTPSDSEVDSILNSAALNGNKLVVIDFTASWCGPCRAIAPLYEELSEEFDDVVFLKIDVDESPETAQKYSVSAMPTFLFVKAGEVVDKLMGANPARLKEMIQEYM